MNVQVIDALGRLSPANINNICEHCDCNIKLSNNLIVGIWKKKYACWKENSNTFSLLILWLLIVINISKVSGLHKLKVTKIMIYCYPTIIKQQ